MHHDTYFLSQIKSGHYWGWGSRDLMYQFVRRYLQLRYRGTALGFVWSLLNPCLMILVYTLIFRHAFKVQWHSESETALEFALQLLAGMTIFSFFSEVISRSPNALHEQTNLVKKVRFPLPILAWSTVFGSLIYVLPSLALLLLGTGIYSGFHWSYLALPIIWLPLLPLLLGISWLFSSVGVYLRDINQVLGLFLGVLQFLSPIFYPISALPAGLAQWIAYNPLTPVIEQTRAAIFQGVWPLWSSIVIELLVGMVVAYMGAWVFERLRAGFADVL